MPDKTFTLEVITPDRKVFSDDQIVSVTLPGIQGYLGVLANHEPLMTALAIGALDYRRADGTVDAMALTGGFVEVFDNKVTVLADVAEKREEIDIERAEKPSVGPRKEWSRRRQDIDLERARISLMRALNRLNVAKKQF